MEAMAGQYESSEEVTVVEVQFKIQAHHRQKYRCRCNANVVTAPGPDKLIPGGRYSVEFAAHSATAKFCDHIPLERQCRMMARQGLEVTSQTLWDQQAALAEHLEPTWRELWRLVLQEDLLHVDETGWKMMAGKGKTGSEGWTLFGLTCPELAAYHLESSKSTTTARKILSGFAGTLVVDGYAVYPLVAALEEGPIRIAHCWAHADRKFKEAKDPPAAIAEIRGLIAKLYEVERKVEGPFPGNEAAQRVRLRLRAEESAEIIEKIRDFAFSQGGLHRSAFGKALRYLLKHWKGLTVFLHDPKVPLSNNAAERALRGPVVGRKNFYGKSSPYTVWR
jgi:transposase